MINQLTYKVFSLTLATLVVLSTVTFTIEKHFCGDTLVDTSVFSELRNCGMNIDERQNSTFKKSCCKNEIETIKGQDKLKTSTDDELNYNQQLFITYFIYSYSNLFESLPKQVIPHKDYSPPNLVSNIRVLDQVFII